MQITIATEIKLIQRFEITAISQFSNYKKTFDLQIPSFFSMNLHMKQKLIDVNQINRLKGAFKKIVLRI